MQRQMICILGGHGDVGLARLLHAHILLASRDGAAAARAHISRSIPDG